MNGPLTQREAAQRWGIPWTTFRRAVKAGKVSIGADKRIDIAEMVRVFGEPVARAEIGTNGPLGTSVAQSVVHPDFVRLKILETENAMLRDQLRETIAAKDANLADLRAEVLRLTHDSPSRRRWWPWGKT